MLYMTLGSLHLPYLPMVNGSPGCFVIQGSPELRPQEPQGFWYQEIACTTLSWKVLCCT